MMLDPSQRSRARGRHRRWRSSGRSGSSTCRLRRDQRLRRGRRRRSQRRSGTRPTTSRRSRSARPRRRRTASKPRRRPWRSRPTAGALAGGAASASAPALALDPVAKARRSARRWRSNAGALERALNRRPRRRRARRARSAGDLDALLEPLDASTRELVLERKFELVFQMWDSLSRRAPRGPYAPRSRCAADRQGSRSPVGHVLRLETSVRLLIREAVRQRAGNRLRSITNPSIRDQGDPSTLDRLAADLSPVLVRLRAARTSAGRASTSCRRS